MNEKIAHFDKKLTPEEVEEVKEVAHRTNIALQLISKGRVWIEVNESSCKIAGDEEGAKVIMESGKKSQKIQEALDYFGWKYEIDIEGISGEGILAYMLFRMLMGDIDDLKITREFFQKINYSMNNLSTVSAQMKS